MLEPDQIADFRHRAEVIARRLTATPILPAVVAAVLGLYQIGQLSIWLDEAFSVAAARLPTRELLHLLIDSEMHASPYYLALHFWTALGTGEAAVRSLSVVFGVVAVVTTFYVGRRYGVGFAAALILACFPYFIRYEQEARTYTLSIAGSAMSTLLYLRMVDLSSLPRTAMYWVAAAAMIYIHPLSALAVVAHGVHYLFVARADLKRAALVYGPIAVAWLPMVVFAINHPGKIAWIQPTTVDRAVEAMLTLGGGAVLTGAVLVLLALGMRRDLPAIWLLLPVVGVFAISILVQPVLNAPYMLFVLPAGAVILARNRRIAVAGLLCLSLIGTFNWYDQGTKNDWRSAAAWMTSAVQPGDGVVFAPDYLRLAIGYYARVGDPLYRARPWSEADLAGGPTDLAGIEARSRIWLVEGHGRELPDDVRAALAAFEVAEVRGYTHNSISVTLLERPATP